MIDFVSFFSILNFVETYQFSSQNPLSATIQSIATKPSFALAQPYIWFPGVE